ncbi:MAG: superoxide dismutase family protein [Candidatus Hydrogenedentes bacterium]|nr:superoxide dismutase family protein [Candidatus Hydrogenedentota bacterium]
MNKHISLSAGTALRFARRCMARPSTGSASGVLACAVLLATLSLSGAQALAESHHGAMPTKAIATISGTAGNDVSGTVTFTQQDDGVLIEADITGLSPGKHGFHIHQYGDISAADGKSTGGHFNPAGNEHAGPEAAKRHVGDLGNLEADENGHAMYKRVDTVIQIHGQHTILSRAVTIHAGADDLTSQPTGAAGARVAHGIIGVAKSE